MSQTPWVGVDFDGTLATWDCPWIEDPSATGDPIPEMVDRVKQWLRDGIDVRIFTARCDRYHPTGMLTEAQVKQPIEAWCLRVFGRVLPITNQKDYWCRAIYDDRAYHVVRDTGELKEEEGWPTQLTVSLK
jgi:hypothetical protein